MLTSFTHPELYGQAILETVQMLSSSLLISILLGVPLGIILVITRPGHIYQKLIFYHVLNVIINIIRSVPFIILLVAILPFTKFIVGTSIGVKGAIVPLVIYTAPYISRLIESALLDVDPGIIEAFQAMGASKRQIVYKVLLKEARPGIVLALTIATIGLIGATAMAGVVGAGGLGDLAVRYGYQRFEPAVMLVCVVLLILLVQGVQSLGNIASKKLRRN